MRLAAFLLALLLCVPASAAVTVPPGFRAEVFAGAPDLSYVTSLAFDAQGRLHVGEADVLTNRGRVLRVEDLDGDGQAETIRELASGFGLVTGLTFRGHGFSPADRRGPGGRPTTDLERIRRGQFRGQALDLYVSHFVPGGTGTISRVRDDDGDGTAEVREDVVTGLPSDGQNGNQQVAIGNDGRLYFGQGARTNDGIPTSGPDDGPLNGTILRVQPDGSGLEVHARGLRNVFDLAFTADGELLATENGPDPTGSVTVEAPDELNAILPGGHYGWPDHHGFPPEDTGTLGPIALFPPSASADGIAVSTSPTFCGMEGDLFVAQFGSFSDPTIGRKVVRVRLPGRRGVLVDSFATGFGRPLDLAVGPEGDLYVADFSNAFFAPRSAAVHRIRPVDADADGTPDVCEQ